MTDCAAPRHDGQDEPFDWATAGQRLMEIEARMMHHERAELRGAEFTGEALRRLWEQIGRNWVPYEEHMRVLQINRSVDRANGEQAQKTLAHRTAEYERRLRDARKVLADMIRSRCNEVTVPSRYRREGVLLAAAWLDGGMGDAR